MIVTHKSPSLLVLDFRYFSLVFLTLFQQFWVFHVLSSIFLSKCLELKFQQYLFEKSDVAHAIDSLGAHKALEWLLEVVGEKYETDDL